MSKVAKRTEFEKPVEVQPPELSMLWEDFRIFDPGKEHIIECRHCKKRWALAKVLPVHTGNILVLLNHARSH